MRTFFHAVRDKAVKGAVKENAKNGNAVRDSLTRAIISAHNTAAANAVRETTNLQVLIYQFVRLAFLLLALSFSLQSAICNSAVEFVNHESLVEVLPHNMIRRKVRFARREHTGSQNVCRETV